jgi:DNA-binding NarL/FixJ family response regulator
MKNLRVLVADDHEIFRKGVCSILLQQGWEVVGEAANGREAVEKAKCLCPDITVIDISMPELNGLEATRQMLKNDNASKILVLSMHESDSLMCGVFDAGARGYLLKTDSCRDLAEAVETISANKTYFTANMAEIVQDRCARKKFGKSDPHNPSTRLTPRQREILQLLADGKSSKEVATTLGLSTKTAETHRSNIMRRLNYHSVTDLVRYAIRNNVVQA